MPLFAVYIRKAVNTSGVTAKWSNRYFVDAADATQALQMGHNFWTGGERTFHNQLAYCYEIYVNNTQDPPNTPGQIMGLAPELQRGSRPATAVSVQQMLPLFNVIRVDFPVVNSRPSRKFYRVPLLETDVTAAQPDADVLASVISGCTAIATAPESRDPDGEAFTGSVVRIGLTSRRLGREASMNVPIAPPFN